MYIEEEEEEMLHILLCFIMNFRRTMIFSIAKFSL